MMEGVQRRSNSTISTLLHSMDKPELGHTQTKVNDKADQYLKYFNNNNNSNKKTEEEVLQTARKENAVDVSNKYYDLTTDFYEYGWGEGFHFASLRDGESRDHSFSRYEYKLALKLQLNATDKVLDVGCGIGGPARTISLFSGARVVGINCNDYQLNRARTLTEERGMQQLCSFKNEDFHSLTFGDSTFDKAYAIEATCHARDLLTVYKEIYRVLKPGGRFASYEWIMTDLYNPDNPCHNKLKNHILEGDGLYDVVSQSQLMDVIRGSGFEVVEVRDEALTSEVPWYSVLEGGCTLRGLRATAAGRWLTHLMLVGLEGVGLAPQGSVKVHRMLCKGADGLRAAGREGIFSPMCLVVLKNPKNREAGVARVVQGGQEMQLGRGGGRILLLKL